MSLVSQSLLTIHTRDRSQYLGNGSHRRRTMIMNGKLESERLFEDLMKEFRNRFKLLADNLQTEIDAAVETHLGSIRTTLDVIRCDNAELETEQDPEFHSLVEAAIRTANHQIQRIQAAVGS